uniref:Uncharacterized protein n=2 Tax=Guillardia theta TaxID=55529 RepID=A0A7S4PQ30_GUITH|mmetsp:Transcript_9065/g.30205  ORF Transcript_9065/g.30205 Transcript_9065/m.30205 type:complete len:301 (+) Transcript_9065:414-1316(+)
MLYIDARASKALKKLEAEGVASAQHGILLRRNASDDEGRKWFSFIGKSPAFPPGVQVEQDGTSFIFLHPVAGGRFGLVDHSFLGATYMKALRFEAEKFRTQHFSWWSRLVRSIETSEFMRSRSSQMSAPGDHHEADEGSLSPSRQKPLSLENNGDRQRRHRLSGREVVSREMNDQSLVETFRDVGERKHDVRRARRRENDKVGEKERLKEGSEKATVFDDSRVLHDPSLLSSEDSADNVCTPAPPAEPPLSSLRSRLGHVKHGLKKILSTSSAAAPETRAVGGSSQSQPQPETNRLRSRL